MGGCGGERMREEWWWRVIVWVWGCWRDCRLFRDYSEKYGFLGGIDEGWIVIEGMNDCVVNFRIVLVFCQIIVWT